MKVTLHNPVEGYELYAEYTKLWIGDTGIDANGDTYLASSGHMGLKLTPERKVVDWGKVDKDVLVHPKCNADDCWVMRMEIANRPVGIYDGWQAHITGGECPVDADAFMVEIRRGAAGPGSFPFTAREVNWYLVSQYRVTGLADGYEYK